MHIADVLHDLIAHTTAYTSDTNRDDAHQAVDDAWPDHAAAAADEAETARQQKVAALRAELAALEDGQPAPEAPPAAGPPAG